MSTPLRNVLSAALFAVSLAGVFVELRYARMGLPGPHRLAIAVYIIVAVYAAASIVMRSMGLPRR